MYKVLPAPIGFTSNDVEIAINQYYKKGYSFIGMYSMSNKIRILVFKKNQEDDFERKGKYKRK